MTTRLKTEGIVFQTGDRNEADRVFSVFTKDFGRVELFAKAIRKMNAKLRSGIDLFSISEIEFVQGKSKKTLIDAVVVKKQRAVFADAAKLETAAFVSRKLDELVNGSEKDERLYDLIKEVFYSDVFSVAKQSLLAGYFVLNFFALQGKKPEMASCVLCGGKLSADELYFSFKDGGTLCNGCGRKTGASRISSETVKVIRLMLERDLATLSRLKLNPGLEASLREYADGALAVWGS